MQAPLQPAYPDQEVFDAAKPPEASPKEEGGAAEIAPQERARGRGKPSPQPVGAQPPRPPRPQRQQRNRGRGAPRQERPRPERVEAPPPAAPAPPKQPRGIVVLTIGLPGSGKTSWFKRRGITPLSSDLLRALLFDDMSEQRHQDLVFGTLRSLLRARLIARMPWNYVDATNLSPKERRGWIKMAQEFGYEVQAVFFDVPLEVCMERNQRRQRVVPEDVMQRMASKLRPPTFDEGFAKITMVRVKHAEPGEEGDGGYMGGYEPEGSD